MAGAAGTWRRGYDAVVCARGGGAATVDPDPGYGEGRGEGRRERSGRETV